ncbi:MAG: carboxypeptidase-like regulatory domain-containing protein, partial [Alistipes sp.]|nr:carboxypeptidase-like regulatory domain-containing protein [Alistipes sp.]
MKIRNILLCGIMSLLSLGAVAQNVKGTVRDASTDEMLIGASVYWLGTNIGVATTVEGDYELYRVKGFDKLVATYVGYKNDTITVTEGVTNIDFKLESDTQIEAVVVEGNLGNYVKRDGVIKSESISFAGLCKMACCNLAESFENSASVTVGYS